jgi:modulator of FtsH protease
VNLSPLHEFFSALANGAAALLGLLFVAVSINVRAIVRHDDTRELARVTFISFIGVLLYALYVLLPQPIGFLGEEIALTSAAMIALTAPRFVLSFVRERSRFSRRTQVLRFGVALLLQVAALVVGIALIRGNVNFLSFLIGVEITLLASAARNCWEMLVKMGAPAD